MEYELNADGSFKLDAEGNKIPKVAAVVDPPVTPPGTVTPPPANADDVDLEKLDEKTRNYIKKLRQESGGYRTKLKTSESNLSQVKRLLGLEAEDQTSPEQRIEALQQQTEAQQFQSAVLQNALEHGVGKDGLEYFTFLLAKARDGLNDGEEVTEEEIAAAALEAKAKSIKPKATSSVTPGNAGTPPPTTGGEITVEAFAKMGVTEKSKIFTEQPELYERLWKQMKEKKLI